MRTTSRLLPAEVLLLVASLTPILTPISDAATPTSGVTRTKAVSRVHLVDGHDQVVDRRTVTVSVDQTQQLRDRQVLEVDWKGAHPTGNKVADVNSAGAADQEYPLVLLECRGVDSTTAAASARLTPSTCWTQTPIERYLASPGLQFPPWRVDRYATPADRHRVVGVPTPLPSGCFLSGYPEHWLHFRGVTGTDYAGGPVGGCAGIAPEQTTGGSTTTSLPGNTTYGFSDADGSGQARFVVWNSLTNASLGCGPSVPCALVAVPVEGISCDVAAGGLPPADRPTGDDGTAAADACTATAGTSTPAAAVKGNLW